ncbi:MAG: hypothetical protein EBU81_11925, partial [Proteobacteria bacterium]|nr:hypothetical protein [Pseudomonadota bacterium]
VRSQPGIAVKVLYRLWSTEDPTLPAISSVYRCLRSHDLDRRSRHRQLHQAVSGPTKAFEAPAVNELWMADFSPGPHLLADSNATTPRGTHLCAIIDDHSRLVVAALYHPDATTRSFHATLKEALRRRGLPRKLYTDQGGPFVNDHTRLVCANLNIRLLHAKPYHAWSKGKIERFFRTVQEDFEALQRRPGHGPATLDELNGRLADWLQSVYHVRVHQGTDQPPQTRFQNASHQIRSLDPTLDLDRLFFSRVNRTVRKDGTLRLDCHLYEVDPALRGLEVQLCFDPWTLARVEVSYRGQSFGLARPVSRAPHARPTHWPQWRRQVRPGRPLDARSRQPHPSPAGTDPRHPQWLQRAVLPGPTPRQGFGLPARDQPGPHRTSPGRTRTPLPGPRPRRGAELLGRGPGGDPAPARSQPARAPPVLPRPHRR